MKSTMQKPLFKALLLSGALLTGWAANAQSAQSSTPPPNQAPSDSSRPAHKRWQGRPGGDGPGNQGPDRKGPGNNWRHDGNGPEAFEPGRGPGRDGFRNGRPGGRQGMAWNHRRGFGEGREGIRYTPEQRKQVTAINKEYRQKQADLYAKDNITLKEYKNGLLALGKEKKSKLQALLTPQQKEQIEKRKKSADENRQVMAAAHMERLKLRLNLSDDQVSKLKSGQENLHQQLTAIHQNDNLLPDQKRQQMKDLIAKRNDIYKSVLTPDQLSKFEQMHKRPDGFRGPGGPRGPRGDRGPGGRDRGFGDGFDGPGMPGEGEADAPGPDGPDGHVAI